MAIYLENMDARVLVGTYFECRKTNTYPAPGSWFNQTPYCQELFEYLDSLRATAEIKNLKAAKK